MINLISFSKQFLKDHMVLFYRGVFDDSCTNLLIDITHNDLERKKMEKTSNKASFLLAECFQNVVRHGLKSNSGNLIDGFFGLRNNDTYIHIYSSNLINKEQADNLEKSLQVINQMSKEELKAYYLEILNNGVISEKGGGGLGLIEMARKSGHPLQFSILEQDKKSKYFCLQVDMESKQASAEEEAANRLSIEQNIAIQHILSNEHILIYYKGDFGQDAIIPVLHILKENAKEMASEKSLLMYHVSVELLQNITHHGLITEQVKPGIFVVEEKDGFYHFSTINYITKDQFQFLKEHLEKISSMDKSSLKKWYLQALKESARNDVNNSAIGLIDLGRSVSQPLKWHFSEEGEWIIFAISAIV